MDGKIYLDYNATSPLDPSVINGVTNALTSGWANPSSSNDLGRHAKFLVDQARSRLAKMLDAKDSDIVFTSGGTEANNMVLWTAVEYYHLWLEERGNSIGNLSHQPHILTCNIEHDAILLPLKHYQSKHLADTDFVPVSKSTGQLNADELLNHVKPNTCLVSIMLANNETGVIMPVAEISKKLKEINKVRISQGLCRILFHTDAAQAIGKVNVRVDELGVDYLTVVGHKFYGPRIGALYVRDLGKPASEIPLHPMLFGGGQERSYRPGTENTPMIVGLGIAAELVSKNLSLYKDNMMEMRNLLEHLLNEEFGGQVTFNCRPTNPALRLPNTSSVSFRGTSLTGGDILNRCPDLMASTRAACHGSGKPSEILIASGVSLEDARTAIRLSIGRDTTAEQIHRVVQMLRKAL